MINEENIRVIVATLRGIAGELVNSLRCKIDKSFNIPCYPVIKTIDYVILNKGTEEDKLKSMIAQLRENNISIIPTSHDSQIVRSAIVATLGEQGLKYWLEIRKTRDNYNEMEQIKRYNDLLKYKEKNNLNFGVIVNKYKEAIDSFNEANNPLNPKNLCKAI